MELHPIYLQVAAVVGFLMAFGIGANDVSNAMGTSVGSKAINVKQAIIIAAIFEFLGAFFAGSEVTNTIRSNLLISEQVQDFPEILTIGMLAALSAAAIWLAAASFFGWPVSTTHTIIGAIIGFAIINIGSNAINWQMVLSIILGWLISPIIGAIISYGLFVTSRKLIFNKNHPINAAKKVVPYYIFICTWIILMISCSKLSNLRLHFSINQMLLIAFSISFCITLISKIFINRLMVDPSADRNSHYGNVERIFAILMVFTACAMAFAHGSNDVANAIGPVAAIAAMSSDNPNSNIVPIWILLLGASGIVVGLALYGYKVMATVGKKITLLTPSRGFAATLATASTVVIASQTGLPISTTHTLVGSILGVGLARGIHAINLNVIRNIALSWFITLPAGAIIAIGMFPVLKKILQP